MRKKRNFYKALATVLSLLLLSTCISYGTVDAPQFSDIPENAAYRQAVEYLSQIGVMSGNKNGQFRPDSYITRAEFAAILINTMGYAQEAASIKTCAFPDVPAGNWATGYIAKAAELGFLSGYKNGNFGPNDSITCEQAITMLVKMCGYESMATEKGGYPNGYWQVGTDLGLFKDVTDATIKTKIRRSSVAQMLYNSNA